MAVVPAPEYEFTLSYMLPFEFAETSKRTVDAAYFVEEGALTVFKDRVHQAVFGIRTDMVVAVERGAVYADES